MFSLLYIEIKLEFKMFSIYIYLKNTTVTVLKNVSFSVDYVQVRQTERKCI